MPAGFNYPKPSAARRHGPRGYASYESYRPWLRDEFAFRCVYCLIREQWGRVTGEFHLDHYLPQLIDATRAAEYANLLYCCASCNLSKGSRLIPNPTTTLTADQVSVDDSGAIVGLTENAVRLIRVLDLDDEEHRQWRRLWMRIIELAQRHERQLHEQLLGFPDDMPDLSSLRPPDGNLRPEGIEQSYFEQRRQGHLASTY